LEQVMLKATRPDDSPVKGKHVERLVGVTYQIAARYDIYDAVLRKLWNKMAERDWRTTIKALYILHRFSADGAPEHQAALKARLRELRRTRDPKRKGKFFQSQQLLAGDSTVSKKFQALHVHLFIEHISLIFRRLN
jgi:ANTH domain